MTALIPLKDNLHKAEFPRVNALIVVVSLAVFVFERTVFRRELIEFYMRWGMVPSLLLDPLDRPTPIATVQTLCTPISSLFIHGGYVHLLMNLWVLWVFGRNVEDRLGRFRYLIFFIMSGLVSQAVQAVIDPSSTVPVIGASGAIAGVMGLYLVLFPRAKIDVLAPVYFIPFVFTLPVLVVLGGWFLLQAMAMAMALAEHSSAHRGVAVFAHGAGFLCAWPLFKVIGRRPPDWRWWVVD